MHDLPCLKRSPEDSSKGLPSMLRAMLWRWDHSFGHLGSGVCVQESSSLMLTPCKCSSKWVCVCISLHIKLNSHHTQWGSCNGHSGRCKWSASVTFVINIICRASKRTCVLTEFLDKTMNVHMCMCVYTRGYLFIYMDKNGLGYCIEYTSCELIQILTSFSTVAPVLPPYPTSLLTNHQRRIWLTGL